MDSELRDNTILYFTLPTVLLVLVTSLGGLLYQSTYARETSVWVAQAIGQDIIDLVILVPVLLISAFLARAGKRSAFFVWLGAMMYTAYTFVIYSFGLHFNTLFLVYCSTLGLAIYAIITLSVKIGPSRVKEWFDATRQEHITALFVLAAGIIFYLMWLKEDLPAMINDQTPPSLQAIGLLTNPVHVLDLSLILPGFIIISALLIKKHAFGYFFGPVLLVFAALMDITIGAFVVVMQLRGLSDNMVVAWLFAAFALVCLAVLTGFLRHMKKAAA